MLSDEQLIDILTDCTRRDLSELERARAVAEAAVKDAVGGEVDIPLGAIHNGRAFIERVQNYGFKCEGGPLENCGDWQQLVFCFAHLSEWAESLREPHGEPVAWMSPGKERLEFSRPDTVYGSHTIPLYRRPQASAAVPEAWREVMQGLVECARDELVRCEGMKCREPNCISCNDELEATTSVERSREFVFRARAMLAALEQK